VRSFRGTDVLGGVVSRYLSLWTRRDSPSRRGGLGRRAEGAGNRARRYFQCPRLLPSFEGGRARAATVTSVRRPRLQRPLRARAIIILLPLCGASFSPAYGADTDTLVHQYVNCDYGYKVRVPKGLIGRVPPYALHGFRILLLRGRSTIRVYNQFNMVDSTSLSEIADHEMSPRSQGKTGWSIERRESERVAGLDAVRVTAKYTRGHVAWKDEHLILYRPLQEDGLGNIVYSLGMSVPANLYSSALEKFNRTVEGFQLTELPLGPCRN